MSCPKCGHCPHCGRVNSLPHPFYGQPYAPMPIPVYPSTNPWQWNTPATPLSYGGTST